MQNIKSGDRVWAPWEGQYLYSATVIAVTGPNVTVRFDTGEEKPDLASNLRPLQPPMQLANGQQIFMMHDSEAKSYLFYPAKVLSVEGEYVDALRDDGVTDRHVHVKRIRIPEADLPLQLPPEWTLSSFLRVKQPAKLVENVDALGSLYQPADRVLARWRDYYWYPATVMSLSVEGVHIRYSDGDLGVVGENHLMPLFCEEGERIYIRPPEEARLMYSPAIVTHVAGELLDVEFEETELGPRRQVAGLSMHRARFWRIPKGIRSRRFATGEQVLVLLGDFWYPGRILPERQENTYTPADDVVCVELMVAAQDVMVTPELIKPLKFSVGEKVEVARGQTYTPGIIAEVRGDKILIAYTGFTGTEIMERK